VIGDSIAVDGIAGSVEHIGLKTTRLRSPSGEQIVMGNSELLKGRIHNYKRMIERRVVFTTDVVYGTPPETVARIPTMLREIVLAQSPVRVDRSHFATYTDSALRFETVYYVLVPDYTRFMDIQQTVNLEILRRFTAEGITLAYPTRVVYAHGGPGADGRAPAGPGDASAPGPSPSASPG
jgi:small-conductance mechanosensitive channel